jgi:beta-alanine degradation protein BauB
MMMRADNHRDDTGPAFANWPKERIDELRSQIPGGRVGQTLVSENDLVRVWHLTLGAGERIGFHRHVLDYFWTVLCDGTARSHYGDGSVRDAVYRQGDTRHFTFEAGEDMVHDLENTGSEPLVFVTVEFKQGKNDPLPIVA